VSDELREYLRDKRVVIVGPSACLEGQRRGAWIDEHDVVVRVNIYQLGEVSVRADVGSRTDVLYHVLFSEKHRAEIGREHTADEVARWRADGLRFLVTQQAATSGRVRDLLAVSGDLPVVHVPRVRDELRRECGTPPNTGTVAITHLLSLPIASLDVVGFDFYASPYYAAYLGLTRDEAAQGGGDGRAVPAWGQTPSRIEIHEQESQKAYLRDLYRREERLSFDEAALAGLGLPTEGPTITALVPMKGHSERVPGKNTRIVAGRPLLAWLLTTLTSARRVSRVVVDTDDGTIAALVREHAPTVEVLMRPDHLRDGDTVNGNDLIAWELSQVEGEHFGQFHVTSPLLEAATIDRAVEAYFAEGEHDSLFAVSEHHIWLFRADGTPVNSDTRRLVRSQDLEPLYEDNNAIHLFSRASFARTGSRMGERPRMFPISRVEATDIDYEDDLRIAEALLELREAEARERATRKAKSPMGAVVYSTQKQPDGSYAVRGAVNGDKRTVYARFEGDDPTIAMCKQALLDGGTSAVGAVEPGSESPPGESDSTAGQPDGTEDAEQPEGNTEQDAERDVLAAALLDLSVEALEEQLPTVDDAALLEAALAVEQSEDGKGRKGAVAALEARIAALTEGVTA